MTFLPIVNRELRVASRRPATYWSRTTTALVAIVITATVLLSAGARLPPAMVSGILFKALTWFTFIYCLFLGASVTADSISSEKRDGTLGLLFLTDLKGYDVVTGKLAASSLNAFYGLLATLPVLAIPLLLGGVAFAEFCRVVVVLLNTLFFSLTAGMLASALSLDARKAAGRAGLFTMFFTMGLPLCCLALQAYFTKHNLGPNPAVFVPFLLPSPGFACVMAFAPPVPFGPAAFWGSIATTHLLAWAFFTLASWITPRTWQDKPVTVKKLRWRDRFQNWTQGSAATRKGFRTRLLDINVIYWLSYRDRLKQGYVWAFLAAAVATWCWGFWKWRDEWLSEGVCIATALILHLVLKLWLSSEAVRRFSDDLQSGALELVLSTSLTVDEVLRGQLLALKQQFARPIAAVLLLDASLVILSLTGAPPRNLADALEFISLFVAGMIVLVADLFTLSWVGMWMGLTAKHINKASGETIGRVLGLPWIALYLLFGAGAYLNWQFNLNFNPSSDTMGRLGLISWLGLSLGFDYFFWRWSRNRLRAQFREMALRRYAPETNNSVWHRLGKLYARWRKH
jgi:ABC-type transport system involved in multi-copper enzyme maturation permease subunit